MRGQKLVPGVPLPRHMAAVLWPCRFYWCLALRTRNSNSFILEGTLPTHPVDPRSMWTCDKRCLKLSSILLSIPVILDYLILERTFFSLSLYILALSFTIKKKIQLCHQLTRQDSQMNCSSVWRRHYTFICAGYITNLHALPCYEHRCWNCPAKNCAEIALLYLNWFAACM